MMRTRWIVLASVAGTALVFAIVLLALGYALATPWLEILGLVVAFGVGLVTAFKDYRRRWPAAVALIAVSPMLMVLVPQNSPGFRGFGMENLLMLYAVGGVAVSSLTILLASIPRSKADHVPPARLVR
jgi:hypothetical protein